MADRLSSYLHRGGNEPLTGATIPEHFSAIARRFPERPALVSVHQNRRLNYSELEAAIDHLARGLLGLGFKPGQRIGVWSTNNIEWVLLQMATARIGIILVNINPANRKSELGYSLHRSEVQGLFLIPSFRSSDYVAILTELIPPLKTCFPEAIKAEDFPFLQRVILYNPADPENTVRPFSGFTLWQEVLRKAQTVTQEALDAVTTDLDRDDPINIQYTSGTTGFPKAVVLSHLNILNNALFGARAMHFSENDRLCVPVPLYHCFGMVLSNLLCLATGACIVLPGEHFDPFATLQAIAQEQCTAVHGVPTMFIAQLEHPRFPEFDLSSLRTGIMAGAPCPPALMTRVMEQMHCSQILIGYGETEASPLTHLTAVEDPFAVRVETVGRNLPHQEVKVVATDSGKTVAIGEIGEICFRGYHIMKGYYGDSDATREAIDNKGWLHSGDLGIMDNDGYIRITGRLKEMIVRGGENIYPREIEDFLFTHPKVAEVAVFGIPDIFYGEEVIAWIKLRSGEAATEAEIKQFCKDQIAHFKIPLHIWFVEEFPMTVTGKLQKFRMRELTVEKMKSDSGHG